MDDIVITMIMVCSVPFRVCLFSDVFRCLLWLVCEDLDVLVCSRPLILL